LSGGLRGVDAGFVPWRARSWPLAPRWGTTAVMPGGTNKPFARRPKIIRACAGHCGVEVEVTLHRNGGGWCSTCRVRRHRGRVAEPGACCAVCGERDPVVLVPHEPLGTLCRNDVARARRRNVTLEDLRREHGARAGLGNAA
jgi:hypothetical protein